MRSEAFAWWQPRYAERGIATFPLFGRTPTRGYHKVGLSGSAKLAEKMPDADAFGFCAGARNGIINLDVDSPNERVLHDVFDQHGETPIVVRSAGGGFHLPYRYSGEPYKVRPDPHRPIDLISNGGVVPVPPSRKGDGYYQFIQGGLDDLRNLPPLKNLEALIGSAANSNRPVPRIKAGERRKALWEHCMRLAPRLIHDGGEEALIAAAYAFANEELDRQGGHLFTNTEIEKEARRAWELTLTGENRFGRQRVELGFSVVDLLAAADPDALGLLTILQRHHSDRASFALANALAVKMEWTRPRFHSARDKLVKEGIIRCLYRGGRGRNDPPIYGWGKVHEIAHQS